MSERHYGRTEGFSTSALDPRFDPMELVGSKIPFMDPFADDYDNNAFARSSSAPLHRLCPHTAATLSSPEEASVERALALQLLKNMPLQRAPSIPPAGPVLHPEHSEPEQDQLGVAKLTPGQAVHIYKLRKTKTRHTASLLAVEYGVTAKAIRDIWTSRSWDWATRAHRNIRCACLHLD